MKTPFEWKTSSIKDVKSLHDSVVEKNITDALVFFSRKVGFSSITERNKEEWHCRIRSLQAITDPSEMAEYRISFEDISRRVGLSTNAAELDEATFQSSLVRMKQTRISTMAENDAISYDGVLPEEYQI